MVARTHAEQYKQYKDKLDDLGENLKGAKLGIVVPSYMDVDSIEDLSDQAGKKITELNLGLVLLQQQRKLKKLILI